MAEGFGQDEVLKDVNEYMYGFQQLLLQTSMIFIVKIYVHGHGKNIHSATIVRQTCLKTSDIIIQRGL